MMVWQSSWTVGQMIHPGCSIGSGSLLLLSKFFMLLGYYEDFRLAFLMQSDTGRKPYSYWNESLPGSKIDSVPVDCP